MALGLACHQCTAQDDQGLACNEKLDKPKQCEEGQDYCIVVRQFLIKSKFIQVNGFSPNM